MNFKNLQVLKKEKIGDDELITGFITTRIGLDYYSFYKKKDGSEEIIYYNSVNDMIDSALSMEFFAHDFKQLMGNIK